MKDFEEKLKKLEMLSNDIKQSDISLENALKDFEEGIKLAKSMQKELDEMEGKIQILMNSPTVSDDKKTKKKDEGDIKPELGLFDETTEINGTRS